MNIGLWIKKMTVVLIFLILGAGVACADNYILTPLAVPGASESSARGINDYGQIVGECWNGSAWRGFVKVENDYSPIDYSGAISSAAYGINNAGQIVGRYSNSQNVTHGFLKDGTNYTSIDYPGANPTFASGINDSKTIVGTYYINYSGKGFLKEGSDYNLIEIPGTTVFSAADINNSGQILGMLSNSTGSHSFVKNGTGYTLIDGYPGARSTTACGINDSGLIVGYYDDGSQLGGYYGTYGLYHGFLWNGATYMVIDYPGAADTQIFGINDSGVIVGAYLIPPGPGGGWHAFVGTPTPIPGSLLLLGSGLMGLGAAGWRRRKA